MTPLMQGYASEDVLYLTLVYKQIGPFLPYPSAFLLCSFHTRCSFARSDKKARV